MNPFHLSLGINEKNKNIPFWLINQLIFLLKPQKKMKKYEKTYRIVLFQLCLIYIFRVLFI